MASTETRNKITETFSSHVRPHGTLEQVIPGRLWRVPGTLPYPLPREMNIYRFPDGESLLLYSVVALNEEGMKAIEDLGKPVILYVPNNYHRMDIGVYADRYPDARVICPKDCRAAVEKVVKVDGTIEEEVGKREGVLEVVRAKGVGHGLVVLVGDVGDVGKVLFLGDLLFNVVEVPENPGIIGRFIGWVFQSYGPLHMTRFGKWFVLKSKILLAQWLKELASKYQIAALMVCHGDPITERCSQRLLKVAEDMEK